MLDRELNSDFSLKNDFIQTSLNLFSVKMVWFSVLLVIPIITVILLSLVLTISIRKRDKYFWNIKSPPRLPLIGNGLMFFKKPAPQILRNLHSAVKEHGRVVKFWLLNDVIIVVTDPKISEVIFISLEQYYVYLSSVHLFVNLRVKLRVL